MIIIVGFILVVYISFNEMISKEIVITSLIIVIGIILVVLGLDLISDPSWWVQQYGKVILPIGVVITVLGVIGGIYVYRKSHKEK